VNGKFKVSYGCACPECGERHGEPNNEIEILRCKACEIVFQRKLKKTKRYRKTEF